jgi:hypothetical protein
MECFPNNLLSILTCFASACVKQKNKICKIQYYSFKIFDNKIFKSRTWSYDGKCLKLTDIGSLKMVPLRRKTYQRNSIVILNVIACKTLEAARLIKFLLSMSSISSYVFFWRFTSWNNVS